MKKLMLIVFSFLTFISLFNVNSLNFYETFNSMDTARVSILSDALSHYNKATNLNVCSMVVTGGDMGNYCLGYFNWSASTIANASILFNNTPINANKGVYFYLVNGGGIPRNIPFMFYDFQDNMILMNTTNLTFQVKSNFVLYDANNYGQMPNILLLDESYNCVFHFGTSGSDNAIYDFPFCNNYMPLNCSSASNPRQENQNTVTFNKALSCVNDRVTFRYMVVTGFFTGANGFGGWLDNLGIYNYYNASNRLPTLNSYSFNNNSIACIAQNETSKNFDLNLNITDNENDTIYTSFKTDGDFFYKTLYFNKYKCLGAWIFKSCFTYPNYAETIPNNVIYLYNNSCKVNNPSILNANISNGYNFVETNTYAGEHYFLSLKSQCNDEVNSRELFFNVEKPATYFSLSLLDEFGFLERGNMNLTLYNQFLEPVIKLVNVFNFTGSQPNNQAVYYQIKNGSIYYVTIIGANIGQNIEYTIGNYNKSKLFNLTNANYSFYVNVTTQYNIGYYDSNMSDKMVKYFSFDTDNTDYRIRGLNYDAVSLVPSFNIGYPKNITLYGSTKAILYLTDELHLNINYNTYSLYFDVTSCDNPLVNVKPIGNEGDIKEALNAGHIVLFSMCSSFSTIMQNKINTCNMLYYIFLFVVIVLGLGLGYIIYTNLGNSYLSLGFCLLVISLSNILSYKIWLFSLTYIIIWGLLFAVGVVLSVVGIFANKSSG